MQSKVFFKDQKDPAFEKFIKVFLEILDVLKLPAKVGHLSEDDPTFVMLQNENFPDFRAYYEANSPNDVFTLLQQSLDGLKECEKPLNDLRELWLNYIELWTGIFNGRQDIESPHSRSKCNKSRSDLKRCFVAQAFPGSVVNQ